MSSFGSGRPIAYWDKLLRCLPQACRASKRPLRHASTASTTSAALAAPIIPTSLRSSERKYQQWTREEDDLLVKLRGAGISFNDLRVHFLRVGAWIAWFAASTGFKSPQHLPPGFISHSQKADAARLLGAGLPQRRVASKLNVRRAALANYWHILDNTAGHIKPVAVARSRARFTADEDALLIELKSKHTTWSEIVRRLPHRTVTSLKSRWYDVLEAKAKVPDKLPTDTVGLRAGTLDLSECIRLLELYQQGIPARAIAFQLGRRVYSIYNTLRRLDVARRPAESVEDSSQRLTNLFADMMSKLSLPTNVRRGQLYPRRAFSPEEVQILRDLVQDGCSRKYVSRCLGRSIQSVDGKMQQLGLICTHRSEEGPESVMVLREEVLEPAEIAAKLGYSEHYVRSTLRLNPPERNMKQSAQIGSVNDTA